MVAEHEYRIYTFRLHRSGRPWHMRPDEVDWAATQVGDPVPFQAVQFGRSAWYAQGPVTLVSAEALESPAWTVWPADEPAAEGPTMTGEVGHALAAGESFELPATGMVVGGVPRRGGSAAS